MCRSIAGISLLMMLLVLVGCGSADPQAPPTTSVKGTVTFNNAPLGEGTISFLADPPKGFPPGVSPIKDGAFDAKVAPGKVKVEIRSPKDSGKKDGMGNPIMVERIPEKFNTMTTLTADISSTGPNSLKFDLK